MERNDDFKVMVGNHIIGIGQPFAIITGFDEGSKVISEIFYSILDANDKITKKSCYLTYSAPLIKDSEKYYFGIKELWNGFVDQDIQNRIYRSSIYPIFKQNDELYKLHNYTNPVRLTETDKAEIYYLKQENRAFLTLVKNKTKSRLLKDYIAWIEPTFRRSEPRFLPPIAPVFAPTGQSSTTNKLRGKRRRAMICA